MNRVEGNSEQQENLHLVNIYRSVFQEDVL